MYQTSLDDRAALLGPYLEQHLKGFCGLLHLEKFEPGEVQSHANTRGNLAPRMAKMAVELLKEESVL